MTRHSSSVVGIHPFVPCSVYSSGFSHDSTVSSNCTFLFDELFLISFVYLFAGSVVPLEVDGDVGEDPFLLFEILF